MTASEKQSLIGPEPLQWEGDIAARLVEGVDAFLTRELGASVERRAAHWARDLSSAAAYAQSVAPNRRRLALGQSAWCFQRGSQGWALGSLSLRGQPHGIVARVAVARVSAAARCAAFRRRAARRQR